MVPRIPGFASYDEAVREQARLIREGRLARFEYHHYTAFHITIRYVGTVYQMSVAVGGRRPLTGYVVPGHSRRGSIVREFALLTDDAGSINDLLTDLGRELHVSA